MNRPEEKRARLEEPNETRSPLPSSSYGLSRSFDANENPAACPRDWTEELQRILDRRDETLEKFQQLSSLCTDFYSTAEHFGRIIVRERGVPPCDRLIPAVELGGVAGGIKYLYQNIIFKFALDTGEPHLYGTRAAFAKIHPTLIGNDEEAMKVAAHELKGYSAFVSRVDGKIKFALLCTIDYLGYRLVATSKLPINIETLKYGSYDAGVIVKTDPIVHSVMCEVAQRLNLRLHQVIPRGQEQPVTIAGPIDLEVHQTEAGHYYALDFARIFPPDYRGLISSASQPKGAQLTRLLRRELVASFSKSLSSDAFSSFANKAPDETSCNADVQEASEYLHRIKIPEVVRELVEWSSTSLPKDDHEFLRAPLSLYEHPALVMHRHGANMRQLDMIWAAIPPTHQKLLDVLHIQQYSRGVKAKLRTLLRNQVHSFPYSEYKWRAALVEYCNAILKREKTTWDSLEELVTLKFGRRRREIDYLPLGAIIYWRHHNWKIILLALKEVGVVLSARLSYHTVDHMQELTVYDVEHFGCWMNISGLLQESEAIALFLESKRIHDAFSSDEFNPYRSSASEPVTHEHTPNTPAVRFRLWRKATTAFGEAIRIAGTVSNIEMLVGLAKSVIGFACAIVSHRMHVEEEQLYGLKPTIELALEVISLLFTAIKPTESISAQLLLWYSIALQRRSQNLRAIEVLDLATRAVPTDPLVMPAILVCIGIALEGSPSPDLSREPNYWSKLEELATRVSAAADLSILPEPFRDALASAEKRLDLQRQRLAIIVYLYALQFNSSNQNASINLPDLLWELIRKLSLDCGPEASFVNLHETTIVFFDLIGQFRSTLEQLHSAPIVPNGSPLYYPFMHRTSFQAHEWLKLILDNTVSGQ